MPGSRYLNILYMPSTRTSSNPQQAKHMLALPLNLRPPNYRRDHWTPYARVTTPTAAIAAALEKGVTHHARTYGRDHRSFDPVADKVAALAKSLDDLASRGVLHEEVVIAWETDQQKNHALDAKVLWPAQVRHERLAHPEKRYTKRVEDAWQEKAF
ncbi:hypothetical protein BC828DRAFT_373692 [Blastocladiella britannica]|nr:hypothetical protein BC828DRAFT_373692 [Blastocladiella britannica]